MSIEINLLPWREEQRARRSKRFSITLGLAALLGLGGGYGMTWHYQQATESQRERNAHIEAQGRDLDPAIREISELEQQGAQMLEQVRVFTELQNGRIQTVLVMNGLTTSLVDGVYYTQLNRQGEMLRLAGRAENNHQVSDQLRALATVPSLNEPMLSEVAAQEGGEQRSFSLTMSQQASGEAEASEAAEGEEGVSGEEAS